MRCVMSVHFACVMHFASEHVCVQMGWTSLHKISCGRNRVHVFCTPIHQSSFICIRKVFSAVWNHQPSHSVDHHALNMQGKQRHATHIHTRVRVDDYRHTVSVTILSIATVFCEGTCTLIMQNYDGWVHTMYCCCTFLSRFVFQRSVFKLQYYTTGKVKSNVWRLPPSNTQNVPANFITHTVLSTAEWKNIKHTYKGLQEMQSHKALGLSAIQDSTKWNSTIPSMKFYMCVATHATNLIDCNSMCVSMLFDQNACLVMQTKVVVSLSFWLFPPEARVSQRFACEWCCGQACGSLSCRKTTWACWFHRRFTQTSAWLMQHAMSRFLHLQGDE